MKKEAPEVDAPFDADSPLLLLRGKQLPARVVIVSPEVYDHFRSWAHTTEAPVVFEDDPAGDDAEGSLRAMKPEVFHLVERGRPCPYWGSTGEHVVSKGACRCGARFHVIEEVPNVKKQATA